MILTCPQCETRFLLSALVLAPEGRRVKCSNCGEIWFEKPDMKELKEEEGLPPLEDIPDAVKPIPDGSAVPAIHDDEKGGGAAQTALSFLTGGRLAAFELPGTLAVAAFLLLLISGGVLLAGGPLTRSWLPAASFYQALGYDIDVPGTGLVFDQVEARATAVQGGMETLTVKGKIINLTGEAQAVPAVEVALLGAAGDVLSGWVLHPAPAWLEGEADLAFESEHTLQAAGVKEVRLRFTLREKNDGAIPH
ncbi:MAG: zinc-ribbon domain-containing protein [Alphaproteobacteria bacterium]|nr:zinc-ribbon domain-containing protein [Alphaproteobacteria bacterium]